MKAKLYCLFIVLALIAGTTQATAQAIRFLRISGPTNTTIIAFKPDGTLVWSNAQPGATFTIQTVSSLPGGSNWVDYVQLPTTNAVNTNRLINFNPPGGMTLIPAGVFTMGETVDGFQNAIPTNVTVSAFYMEVNLVSSNQWRGVYNWATNHGYGFDHAGAGKASNHPVQTVDWYDTVKWCNARSQQAGLTPVYYTDTNLTQLYTNGQIDITNANVNWAANGYRLATEAEWEKAARGGLSGQRFPWGNTIDWSHANYYSFAGTPYYPYDQATMMGFDPAYNDGVAPYTSPVGSFRPNGYGLFDMSGNVAEWCWDWYGTPYAGGSDPRGPASGTYRVLRGGDWADDARVAQCALRDIFIDPYPITTGNMLGFRCVRAF